MALSQRAGTTRQIGGQLLRAGTSVGANTEEARVSYSRREFACKNAIVLKEARESRFWLRLLKSTGLSSEARVNPLLAEANELVAIFTVTVKKAKKAVEEEKAKEAEKAERAAEKPA